MIINATVVYLNGAIGNATQSKLPIAIGQGEGLTVNLAVVGQNAQPIDLTGGSVSARVERKDGTTLVLRLGTLVSAPGGTAQIAILSSETATWAAQIASWVIWITLASGESYPVMLASDFTIEDNAMDINGSGSTPGPDMLLVGVPVPQSGDAGKKLTIVTVSPLVLGWT